MLCAVIAKSKISDIIDVAKKIEKIKGVNAIEFRLDYLNASEFKNFDKFFEIEKIKKIKIATCMLKNEGGNFKGSIDERNEILKKSENFCDYLTIEMKNFRDVFNSNLILSYHNFEKCPEKNEIEKILDEMEKIKTKIKETKRDVNIIKKIAVKFNSFDDNYKILPFLLEEKNFRNVIILGMGKYGKLSRILNYYFGFLTYVSVEEKTAEGQLSVEEFEKILKILE